MNVRSRSVTGRSGRPNDVTAVDVLSVGDSPSREVAQRDDIGVSIDDTAVDIYTDTAGLGVPVGGHSGDRGLLRRALTRGEVDSLMPGSGAGHWVNAVTEGRCHLKGTGDRVPDIPVSQGVRGD